MKKAIFRELHKSIEKVDKSIEKVEEIIDEAIEDMARTNEDEKIEVLEEPTTTRRGRRKKELNE